MLILSILFLKMNQELAMYLCKSLCFEKLAPASNEITLAVLFHS